MDSIVVHVEEERFVFMLLNESDRFLGLTIRQVLPLFASRQVRDTCPYHGMPVFGLIEGVKVTWRLPIIAASIVEIVPLFLRIPIIGSKVPFTDVAGDVAGGLQHFGNRYLFRFHPESILRNKKLSFAASETAWVLFICRNSTTLKA